MQRAMKWFLGLLASAAFLCGGFVVLHGSLPPASINAWLPAGSLTAARTGAASVLLQDGRLLITGGNGASGALATTDILNPSSGFTPGPPMSLARSNHVAVVLVDGRVLVAGGTDASGRASQSAELFDPAANSWSASGPLMVGRSGATATLLPSGQVLIAGGTANGAALASLELFDPNPNTFSLVAGVLSSARENHAAVLLPDGRVLIAGGWDGTTLAPVPPASTGTANVLASSDIFDPTTGTVTSGPTLSSPRMNFTATTALDGSVVAIGGTDGQNDLASIDVLAPAAGAFVPSGAQLATARQGHLAFLLPHNGNILVVGGTSGGTAVSAVELYTPWTGATSVTGAMASARSGATGSPLFQTILGAPVGIDGALIVAGGLDASSPPAALASAEVYGFATVKTDKDDYSPGETAYFSGSGWLPNETVQMSLVEVPDLDGDSPIALTATADASGNFSNVTFPINVADLGIKFTLTAAGGASQAQTTFTDAPTLTLTPNSGAAGFSPVTVSTGGSPFDHSSTVNIYWDGTIRTTSGTLLATCPTGGSSGNITTGCTFTVPANATAGPHTVVATEQANNAKSVSTTFTVTAASAANSTITGTGPVVADGVATSTVTITLKDASNNPVSGITPTFSASGSNNTYGACSATNGSGVSTCTLSSTTAEVKTLSIVSPVSVTGGTVTFQAGAPAAAHSTIAGTGPVVADGVATSTITITLEDANSNPVSGVTPTFSATGSNNTYGTCSATDASGKSTCTLKSTTAEVKTLSIVTPVAVTGGTVTFTSANVATTLTLDAPSPASVSLGSSGPVTFTAHLTRTSGGAAVSGATINFSVDGTDVGTTATTDGTGTAILSTYNPSTLTAGSHNVAASFTAATISGTSYSASNSGTQTLKVTTPITVNTSVAGLTFTVDGTDYTTPQTFQWDPGSNHTISTTSPQSGVAGTRYVWTSWSDSGAISHSVTAPSTATTYTANFKTQYQVTFNLSGVSTDVAGTTQVISLTSPSAQSVTFSQFSSNSYSAYFDAGSTVSGTFANPLASTTSGKQYALTSGSPFSFSSLSAAQTATGTYKAQWLVTITLSGVSTDVNGSTQVVSLTSPSGSVTFSQFSSNSYSQYFDAGSTVSGTFANPLASTTAGKQYALTSGSPFSFSSLSAPQTATGTYKAQWLVTITLSGVSTDVNGSTQVVSLTSPSGSVTFSQFSSNSYSQYFDAGSTVSGTFADPLASTTAGKRYALTSGSPFSFSSLSAPQTATGTYKEQYQVTFAQSGIGGDTATNQVLSLTVNGGSPTAYSASTLPPATWYDANTVLTYTYSPTVATSPASGKQYALTSTSPSSPYTVTAAQTITGTYKTQWWIAFAQSGLSSDATGTVVTVGASAKAYGDLPFSGWFDDGSTLNYAYSSPVTSTTSGKRYALTTPAPTPASGFTVGSSITITGTYKVQWLITFVATGIGVDATPAATIVTVNGSPQASVSYQVFLDAGSTATYAYSSPITTTVTGKRYILTTPAANPPSGFTVAAAITITAMYKAQYDTQTVVTSSVNPSILAQSVQFTATVTTIASGGGTPTGSVQFKVDGVAFGSAVALSGGTVNSAATATLTVGTHTVEADYTPDTDTYTGSIGMLAGGQKVQYASGGACDGDLGHSILQPISTLGTSVFKQKSTVPAKFRVCDFNGNSIGTPGVVSSFQLTGVINGTVQTDDTSVPSTTPDTVFRWDPTGQQWIFNISTQSMSASNTYTFVINLNDGSTIPFMFGLK